MSTRRAAAVAIALAAVLAAGCMTRPVKRSVFTEGRIEVSLRKDQRLTRTIAKEYEHPVTIAQVRMAHILSRIDLRTTTKKGNQRMAAIPTEMLYPIAEGVSKALGEATADEEVVVMAIRRHRRLKIFDKKLLTSFVAYARDDRLYIHMARSEWEIPPRREDKPPEPRIGEHPMKFRIYAGDAMVPVDKQSVAVEWRDPVFKRPTRTAVRPSGEVVRKTILLESPREQWVEEMPADPSILDELSPDQMRALADLEEQRRRGLLTEGAYKAERKKILAQ
jgi:hypothetical protein